MAVAVGTLPKAGHLDLHSMSQQQIEARAVDIQLLALVILTNRVRPDSKATISELQEGYVFPKFGAITHVLLCHLQQINSKSADLLTFTAVLSYQMILISVLSYLN